MVIIKSLVPSSVCLKGGWEWDYLSLHPSLNLMPNALRRCTLHQFSKGNNQLYLYMLYKYKQLLSTFIAHSIGLQRNRVYCWKWSSSPSASVQNRVQISVHSPVHESSPESRVQVLHQPVELSMRERASWVGMKRTMVAAFFKTDENIPTRDILTLWRYSVLFFKFRMR